MISKCDTFIYKFTLFHLHKIYKTYKVDNSTQHRQTNIRDS